MLSPRQRDNAALFSRPSQSPEDRKIREGSTDCRDLCCNPRLLLDRFVQQCLFSLGCCWLVFRFAFISFTTNRCYERLGSSPCPNVILGNRCWPPGMLILQFSSLSPERIRECCFTAGIHAATLVSGRIDLCSSVYFRWVLLDVGVPVCIHFLPPITAMSAWGPAHAQT